MGSFITYGIYNLIYQVITIGFLFFANTYLNSKIIPDSLRWQDGKIRDNLTGLAVAQTAILLLEVVILAFLLHYINKKYLSSISNGSLIVNWTMGIYLFVSVVFIAYLIYVGFK